VLYTIHSHDHKRRGSHFTRKRARPRRSRTTAPIWVQTSAISAWHRCFIISHKRAKPRRNTGCSSMSKERKRFLRASARDRGREQTPLSQGMRTQTAVCLESAVFLSLRDWCSSGYLDMFYPLVQSHETKGERSRCSAMETEKCKRCLTEK
jgi:hypothetical protein